MKKALTLAIFIVLHTCCFGQLTLELKGSALADSIFFSNITQDNEFQFIRYSDVLDIRLNGPLNDLYNLTFYSGVEKKMNQLWLNGDRVVLKGKFTGKILDIDTVIGSDLYYKSINFRKRFEYLLTQLADSITVNSFLLEGVKDNLDNPYSIEIARNFFMRNLSRKPELRKLRNLLESQDTSIRDHLFNPYLKIENILTRNKIELAKFRFYTPEGKLEPLILSIGKRYLIDMWFVGCAPCIEQHKEMASQLPVLKNNNIEVIGISVDQDQDQWKNFLKRKKYNWLNVRETDNHEQRLRTDMLIESFPTYFLIDSDGVILHRTNSFKEMTTYLKL